MRWKYFERNLICLSIFAITLSSANFNPFSRILRYWKTQLYSLKSMFQLLKRDARFRAPLQHCEQMHTISIFAFTIFSFPFYFNFHAILNSEHFVLVLFQFFRPQNYSFQIYQTEMLTSVRSDQNKNTLKLSKSDNNVYNFSKYNRTYVHLQCAFACAWAACRLFYSR